MALIVFDGLQDDVQKSDIALVLGNKIESDGSPSLRLKSRLDRAVEVFEGGNAGVLLVSGGIGKEGFDEAKVMASYLIEKGIPAARILIDSKGVTTEASAMNTALMMRSRGLSSVIVVSQYFHISRTKLALEKFGVNQVHSAHARFFELRDIYSIPREFFGFISYYFREFNFPKDQPNL